MSNLYLVGREADRAESAPSASRRTPAGTGRPAAKRVFDIALAAILLLATLPILVAIAAAIKLDSRGPIFFRARRVGHGGCVFMMLKFRKMHHDAVGGPLTKAKDPRLTRVGAFLTRTRLDELPQFWDVLRGRMSIVGPRPEDPRFVAVRAADFRDVLAVRPGITGLAQLAYHAESNIVDSERPTEDYVTRILPQKLTLDKLYVSQAGTALDLRIVYWTVVATLLGRPVAVDRMTGAMNVRRRPAEVSIRRRPVEMQSLAKAAELRRATSASDGRSSTLATKPPAARESTE